MPGCDDVSDRASGNSGVASAKIAQICDKSMKLGTIEYYMIEF